MSLTNEEATEEAEREDDIAEYKAAEGNRQLLLSFVSDLLTVFEKHKISYPNSFAPKITYTAQKYHTASAEMDFEVNGIDVWCGTFIESGGNEIDVDMLRLMQSRLLLNTHHTKNPKGES
jgi:hypothetical protein